MLYVRIEGWREGGREGGREGERERERERAREIDRTKRKPQPLWHKSKASQ